jgi:membrane-bound ClpP family serine protease
MNINVGKIDRVLRIVLGLALIVWGGLTANFLGVIGIVLLVTGLLKRCPAYTVAGVSTK